MFVEKPMHIVYISIFPDIFHSFLHTSLIEKAQKNNHVTVEILNPRDFATDKQQQIDDEIYGGGAGMLLKAQPIIDALRHVAPPTA